MAKSRAQKETLLQEYRDTLKDSGGYIAVDVKGMEANTVTELKMKLKEINSNMIVVKNKIFKIAQSETDQPTQAMEFEDATAIIPYSDDPTVPAKMLKEVQKETEMLEARFGVVKGAYLDSKRVMELADIPSREVLLAKMLGSMMAPVSGVANAMSGNVRGFVQVLHQISEGEGSGETAAEEAA